MCPLALRREAWKRLDTELDRGKLAAMTNEIRLADVVTTAPRIVEGKVRGRIAVKVA